MLVTFLLLFLFALVAPCEEAELEFQGRQCRSGQFSSWGNREGEGGSPDLRCFCDCVLVDAEDPAVAAAGSFGFSVHGRGGSLPL